MKKQERVKIVRSGTVRCRGRLTRTHAVIALRLPPGRTMACPICGQRFRRAPDWTSVSHAAWPRPE
ncbi:hypothetical protein [Pontivivens ytuae]|uniref:Zinc finger CHCC-type domain-containing protein n=1 Tax=Pontivivens ytuae TaxID=2789856 RepID=A0A7S9LSX4_9RHOB|nr:hypothetical protein [Pontivivens ytuae]QPH54120.1 hypothetical protein I0K15_20500 [Pontivivens ytuae]